MVKKDPITAEFDRLKQEYEASKTAAEKSRVAPDANTGGVEHSKLTKTPEGGAKMTFGPGTSGEGNS